MTSVAKSRAPARAWALTVPLAHATTVIGLRLLRGVQIALDGDSLWLRSRSPDESVFAATRGLPATARYDWTDDDFLKPEGAVLPVRRMPSLEWTDIREWARVAFPVANVPAALPAPALMQLVPAHAISDANALLVSLSSFLDWVDRATALRIERLRFAANAAGEALVLGTPLPPLNGRPCVETDGVIVPAGFAVHPAVTALVVRQVLNAPADAFVVWDEKGPRVLSAECFVSVSRSAGRLTRLALGGS